MEGELFLWINIFYGWKSRYFILHNQILLFCEYKGGFKLGSLHLQISSIHLTPNDPLKIVINSGLQELVLRAKTIKDKIKWVNALKIQQDMSLNQVIQENIDNLLYEQKYEQEYQNQLKKINLQKFDFQIAQIWSCQAILQQTLNEIQYSDIQQQNQILVVQEQAQKIKQILQDVRKEIQDNKSKLFIMTQIIQKDNQNMKIKQKLSKSVEIFDKSLCNNEKDNIDQESQFQSFFSLDQKQEQFHDDEEMVNQCINQLKDKQLEKYNILSNRQLFNQKDFKQNLMEVFINQEENKQIQNISTWNYLKDFIGNDLCLQNLSVKINEEQSMLQRIAEQIQYKELLRVANEQENSCIRLGYCIAYAISSFHQSDNRNKLPFFCIKGETFIINDNQNDRYISEAIKDNLFAYNYQNQDYQIYGNISLNLIFWGKQIQIKTNDKQYIKLNKYNDFIQYDKPKIVLQNIILGDMKVDYYGDMNFINTTSNDQACIHIKPNTKEITGFIKDINQQVQYRIKGQWDNQIILYNDQQQIKLWENKKQIMQLQYFDVL